MMIIVTSPSNHHFLHPRGLVLNILGLLCQFLGDLSQWIASLSSDSDLNAFSIEEIQRHWPRPYFFFCLIRHESHLTESTGAWDATNPEYVYSQCVTIIILLLAVCQFSFIYQIMATLKEGDQSQMWEFIHIPIKASPTAPYPLVLWLCENHNSFPVKRWSYRWMTLTTFAKPLPWSMSFFIGSFRTSGGVICLLSNII